MAVAASDIAALRLWAAEHNLASGGDRREKPASRAITATPMPNRRALGTEEVVELLHRHGHVRPPEADPEVRIAEAERRRRQQEHAGLLDERGGEPVR